MKEILLIIIVLFIPFVYSYAQVKPTAPAPADTLKRVEILNAERYGYQKKDSLTEVLLLVGKVILKQDNTTFYSDSAIYNRNARFVEAFGHVHINDNDSINAYSDYLMYLVDQKQATLKNKVRLTDGQSNLYTDELEYDVNQQIGVYRKGGKVVNQTSVLTSKEGIYYADIKDVYFTKDVKLEDPKYHLSTDSLLYNTTTEIATFISETFIKDSAQRTILTSEGYYDLKSRNASFGKRPIIHDGASTIIADEVQADDHTGINILTGNAVYKDSAQGIAVLANSIVSNRNDRTFLATQNPLLILKQDKDSVYIAADTLYSGKLSDLYRELDSLRRRDSALQAIALQDSLLAVAAAKDSALRKQQAALKIIASRDSIPAMAGARDTSVRRQDSALNAVARDSSVHGLPQDSLKTIAARNTLLDSLPTDTALKNIARRDSLPSHADTPNPLLERVVQDSLKTIAERDPLLGVSRSDSLRLAVKDASAPENNSSFQQDLPANTTASQDSLADRLVREPTTINTQNDSADRYFRAYHNVRIFSDSLQAVCDSLFYSGKDSIFRLFQDPIVWASASQVTGDTIYLYTKNKKADELYVFENGFVVNKSGENMFNQIRGNRLNGYFKNGEMDYMRAKGNAESVYYIRDGEEKLIGVNKATSDIIDMRFVNKELNRVVFVSQVKGTMYPVSQVPDQDKHLRNFKWLEDKRPKTKFELFGN